MNVTTKLITYATVSNSGTFAGRPYDLYKQVRYDAEKQKGLSLDRPYIFVFYRNMKVKKGRRLVRSSAMLKRTAAQWSLAR